MRSQGVVGIGVVIGDGAMVGGGGGCRGWCLVRGSVVDVVIGIGVVEVAISSYYLPMGEMFSASRCECVEGVGL